MHSFVRVAASPGRRSSQRRRRCGGGQRQRHARRSNAPESHVRESSAVPDSATRRAASGCRRRRRVHLGRYQADQPGTGGDQIAEGFLEHHTADPVTHGEPGQIRTVPVARRAAGDRNEASAGVPRQHERHLPPLSTSTLLKFNVVHSSELSRRLTWSARQTELSQALGVSCPSGYSRQFGAK